MRTHRMKRTVAGIMAAGLIFAACGDDDDACAAAAPLFLSPPRAANKTLYSIMEAAAHLAGRKT